MDGGDARRVKSERQHEFAMKRRVNRLCAKRNESCGFFIFIFPLSTEMKAMTTVTAMKKGLIRKDFKDRD